MKKSSYHNTLQSWIKSGLLETHEITFRNLASVYDPTTKTYKGPKTKQEVLLLNFKHKSFFVRKPYIKDYLEFIKEVENKTA